MTLNSKLIKACRTADIDAIKSAVNDSNVDINSTDDMGWTALHIAIIHGNRKVIECLMNLGALDKETNNGILASSFAPYITSGRQLPNSIYEVVKLIINSIESNSNQSLDLINMIIDAVASHGVQILNKCICIDGYTCSIFSKGAETSCYWLCRLCLELGINVNSLFHLNRTALHLICMNPSGNSIDCIKLLMDYGADIDKYDNNITIMSDSVTPLHSACKSLDIQIIKLLIDYGADISKVTKSCRTVLQLAAKDADCTKLLLNYADMGLSVNSIDNCGLTALHYACQSDNATSCQLLIEAGVDINKSDTCDYTALHWACDVGSYECIKILLKYGADVNQKCRDFDNRTALHITCSKNYAECTKVLLEAGADRDVTSFGKRPIDIARGECANLLNCVQSPNEQIDHLKNYVEELQRDNRDLHQRLKNIEMELRR